MNTLEKAKTRLQEALAKLETTFQGKIFKLEAENSSLKAEIANLKNGNSSIKETETSTSKKKSKADKNVDLIDAKIVKEVDISLRALKKLVK